MPTATDAGRGATGRRAFRVAYDGTRFRGFQRQPHQETVENAIFDALESLGIERAAGKPEGYSAAGRTDAGVSALGQVVAIETPAWLEPRALNSRLPDSIVSWAAWDVDPEFHARFDAVERHYVYSLPRREDATDERRLTAVCDRLSGEHDFRNLTAESGETIRRCAVSARHERATLRIHCAGPGFARQQVRRMVSLIESVLDGDRDIEAVERLLSGDDVDGPEGVAPAPAGGLYLRTVDYPEMAFRVDERGIETARALFENRRAIADTRSASLGAMLEQL